MVNLFLGGAEGGAGNGNWASGRKKWGADICGITFFRIFATAYNS